MSPRRTRQRPEAASEQQSPGNPHALTGAAPHQCTSCGRACGACAEAAAAGHPLPHTIRAAWCRFCAAVYAENAPAADGRVYCGGADWTEGDDGCGRAFPGLARLIESGTPRYRRYCRECREELAAEAAEHRANDAALGVGAVVASATPRPAPREYRTKAVRAAEVDERERNWARGGFRPRPPGPETVESELGDGETAWPGASAHPL